MTKVILQYIKKTLRLEREKNNFKKRYSSGDQISQNPNCIINKKALVALRNI